ncbi:hypothetical protein CAEBREN_21212 [Caenorhabditis brenneri]|uniref:CUB-like domain-containing protein n=1 Tax=Caenorhabditis brenneri TaxID=135651 RepID=G0P9L2_CAEBE|nr:hypothetical protein CAEBREN_21212 [Caenorhabditis brenneri]
MIKVIPILLIFGSFVEPQKVINLNTFGGKIKSEIDATGPYSLYLSASSDSMSRLSQIFIETSNNQQISLYQLKMNKMHRSSGFLQPFRVVKSASIVSNLTDTDMKFLTGFLYVTTRKQMNDNSFYVFDVDQEQIVNLDETKPDNCTVVFLNSNASMTPVHSTTITNWVQSENSSVFIYQGFPHNGEPKSYSQIFSNPVSTTEKMKFFLYIEPFSISLPVFYMRIHKGIQFTINPQYLNINGTTTSFPTTTGFYMKPFNRSEDKTVINIVTVNSLVPEVTTSLTGTNVGFFFMLKWSSSVFFSDDWISIKRHFRICGF